MKAIIYSDYMDYRLNTLSKYVKNDISGNILPTFKAIENNISLAKQGKLNKKNYLKLNIEYLTKLALGLLYSNMALRVISLMNKVTISYLKSDKKSFYVLG